MKGKNIIKLFFILLIMSNCSLFGQQTRIELGEKYFDQYAYKKVIKLYEEIKPRDRSWDVNAKLGDCYYYTSNPEMAIQYYRKALIEKSSNMDSYRLKYALSMLSVNECKTAIDTILNKNKDSLTIFVIAKYFGIEIKSNKIPDNFQSLICQKNDNQQPEVKVENLAAINSSNSDFGTFIFNDILYFASSREKDNKRRHNKRLYKWNEHPYLEIYSAAIARNANDSLKLIPPENSNLDISNIGHESIVAITNDSTKMYFSGSNVKNNKLEYNKRGTSNLKLQRASRDTITNKWVVKDDDKTALDAINLENYSVGSPALSPDNKWLLFVTCAPYSEANGKTDIYYVKIEKKIDKKNDTIITYGTPKNLSNRINTSGRESFPFISKDNTLYFSSDGIYNDTLGLGLLDIYKVYDIDKLIEQRELNKDIDDKVKVVHHLDTPFNSVMDDFAYFIEEPKEEEDCEVYAYFSSNREILKAAKNDSIGDDDIYRVKVKRSKTIRGVVTDFSTQKPLANALVELMNNKNKVWNTVKVDSTGAYSFDVECDNTYRLRGSVARYYDDNKTNISAEANDNINLELKPYPCEITINYAGFDSINQIEFERDAAKITEDAKKILIQVWDMLSTNPDIKIRIESHTDSRGSDDYNLRLSERRAQASKSYLDSLSGNEESQITYTKGYGESRLCISDEEIANLPTEKERDDAHQRNRRSRFIIVDCEDNMPDCPNDN